MHLTLAFLALLATPLFSWLPVVPVKAVRGLGVLAASVAAGFVWTTAFPVLLGRVEMRSLGIWFVDPMSALVASLIVLVYLATAVVSVRYLGHERHERLVTDRQVRLYYVMMHLFAFAMLVTALANHLGVIWFGLEATTLATTCLVAFYAKDGALEAAWKYILLCSTGIALGLVGILMVGHAAAVGGLQHADFLYLDTLRMHASSLSPDIMRWAFVFVFVGIGTKVGFVPLHTWLPDAHSKTPSPISAMLSGILLNVAFVTILRFKGVTDLALGGTEWTEKFFLVFGILSVLLPGFILLIQRNYKRMLAYSSIEHMGLLAFSVGLGPLGLVPAVMHMVGHTLAKSALFFGAGEILLRWKTTKLDHLPAVFTHAPRTAVLFLLAILGILAMPGSTLFASEYLMVGYGINTHLVSTLIVLLGLSLVAVGMMRHTLALLFEGAPAATEVPPAVESVREPWTLTHAVMAGELALLGAAGVFFLLPSGLAFATRVAQSISSVAL
ncbi:hydrogenase 4 subunit F [Candidatus Uhrbacteria bacterium]|nr:hydrogenase 4 subunit F [Candidatus Uhrbacteria bacterium]